MPLLCKKVLATTTLLITASCFATVPSNKIMQISSAIQAEHNRGITHKNNQSLATKKKIYEMFRWFNTLSNTSNPVSRNDINKYFTSNVKIYKNNKLIRSGREQIYHALRRFQQHIKDHKVKMVHVILPFKKMQMDTNGNKVILTYSVVKKIHDGQREIIPGQTLLQLKDQKVQHWYQTYNSHKKKQES